MIPPRQEQRPPRKKKQRVNCKRVGFAYVFTSTAKPVISAEEAGRLGLCRIVQNAQAEPHTTRQIKE